MNQGNCVKTYWMPAPKQESSKPRAWEDLMQTLNMATYCIVQVGCSTNQYPILIHPLQSLVIETKDAIVDVPLTTRLIRQVRKFLEAILTGKGEYR